MKKKLRLKKNIRKAIKITLLLVAIWTITTIILFGMANYIEYRENLYNTYQNK